MYQQFSFMLAVLLVVIAGVTVLIMLEMSSSPQEQGGRSGWGVTIPSNPAQPSMKLSAPMVWSPTSAAVATRTGWLSALQT